MKKYGIMGVCLIALSLLCTIIFGAFESKYKPYLAYVKTMKDINRAGFRYYLEGDDSDVPKLPIKLPKREYRYLKNIKDKLFDGVWHIVSTLELKKNKFLPVTRSVTNIIMLAKEYKKLYKSMDYVERYLDKRARFFEDARLISLSVFLGFGFIFALGIWLYTFLTKSADSCSKDE